MGSFGSRGRRIGIITSVHPSSPFFCCERTFTILLPWRTDVDQGSATPFGNFTTRYCADAFFAKYETVVTTSPSSLMLVVSAA